MAVTGDGVYIDDGTVEFNEFLYVAPENGDTLRIDQRITVYVEDADISEQVPFTIRVWFTPEPAPEPELQPDPVATLLNLSPWQSWVHLYCREAEQTCRATFTCNGMDGEPVTWTVDMEPKTIFSYWQNKTADDGTPADLQAALMDAGKTEAEARRRTTCEVSSVGNLAVRGYTRFGGDPTLIPVVVYD